jgi:carbamoyltransferase
MNSVANGKIYERSPYKNLYIQPAPGDAGGAIGSAFVVANNLGILKKRFEMEHAYWGPSFTDDYHEILLKKHKIKIDNFNCILEYVQEEDVLCHLTAEAISQGKVVGWFQGRMEWGPRALGNRSIVCDPRRPDMKDILNLKIKRRESFRPFAPSILREDVDSWFEENDDVPFMTQVFQIKKEKRNQIPAVTHVDGSGRLQTVHIKTNPRYYKLINQFKKKTGIPIILNTSFNENEPVVCFPDEALETFLRTKMDWLVLGNWIVKRKL